MKKEKVKKEQVIGQSRPKLKISKKVIGAVGAVAIIAVVALLSINSVFASNKKISIGKDDVTTLEKGTLTNAISATGTVESKNTTNVYSNLNYVVNKVNVEVGDSVSANDVLCELDSTTLEDQIETKELSLSVSKKTTEQQLKTAQDTYDATKSTIESGTNSSLVSAKASMDTSYDNWQKAKKTYEDYVKTIDNGTNSAIIQQNSNVESAQNAKETAESAQNSATSEYKAAKEKTDAAKSQLDSYVPDNSNNQALYDAAKTAYDGAVIEQNLKQSKLETEAAAYQTALDAYNADPNSANEANLNSAKTTFDTANSDYETAKSSTENLKNELADAEKKLAQSVDDTYLSLQSTYNNLKAASDTLYNAMKKAEKSTETATDAYNYAVQTREAAYATKDTTLRDYAVAMDSAYKAYVNSQKSYNAADATVNSTLASNKNSVASAANGADSSVAELELEQLKKDLEDTKITAGVNGVVTAVYAQVGSSGSGLLFIVEDVNNLEIETSVKEYDIETVKQGMKVEIKSDATGDQVFQGVIDSIAPTSNKTSQGETDKSGDIVFATKVSVVDKKTDLRIGLNVRLNYIVEKKENVLSVPYEAVMNSEDTEAFVLKLEKTDGGYKIEKVNVKVELENDINIAISGTGIKEGDLIMNEPNNYVEEIGSIINFTTENN